MKTGDLVRFKQVIAGKDDDPPYSLDGQWRIGLLIEYHTWEKVGTVLYRGKTYRIRAENMQKAGKKDENSLLYGTGGIRCEKASAYLKHKGFKSINQLYGGIINYVHEVNENGLENKFIGKNFVFDDRLAERVSDEIISSCHQCGKPCDNHTNCKNLHCNLLFLQCEECKKKYQNCCSTSCIEIINLSEEEQKKWRSGKENKKMFHSHRKVNLKNKLK